MFSRFAIEYRRRQNAGACILFSSICGDSTFSENKILGCKILGYNACGDSREYSLGSSLCYAGYKGGLTGSSLCYVDYREGLTENSLCYVDYKVCLSESSQFGVRPRFHILRPSYLFQELPMWVFDICCRRTFYFPPLLFSLTACMAFFLEGWNK